MHYEKGYFGLIKNDRLVWTAGEADPGFAPVHYYMNVMTPKYISRAFHRDVLLIAEAQGKLYIPDWRKDGPRTLVVAERTE
jgi:hypothetical protein